MPAHAAGFRGEFVQDSLSPHKLRYSFGTAFVASGATLEEATKVMGHASVSTKQIYVEVSTQRLEASVSRLPDVLDMEVS